ncbi:hypothetical protein D3C76_1224350 [compost metagenome]
MAAFAAGDQSQVPGSAGFGLEVTSAAYSRISIGLAFKAPLTLVMAPVNGARFQPTIAAPLIGSAALANSCRSAASPIAKNLGESADQVVVVNGRFASLPR